MCRWNDATSPSWPSPKKRHRRNPSPAHAAAIGIAISIYKRLPKSGKQSKPPAIGGKIDAAACARTGKLSARPAGKPGDFFTAQESLRDRRRCVFEAGRNLSSEGAKNPEPATSGLPPTGAEPRYGSAPGETRSAHRPDEFRPANPRSGWSPPEPVSASPEIARNSVESQRLSTFIDYATLAPFAIDCLETALAIDDSNSGICLWPMTLRNWRSATSKPEPTQRSM